MEKNFLKTIYFQVKFQRIYSASLERRAVQTYSATSKDGSRDVHLGGGGGRKHQLQSLRALKSNVSYLEYLLAPNNHA